MPVDDHIPDVTDPPDRSLESWGTSGSVNFDSEFSTPDPQTLPGGLSDVFAYWNDLRGDCLAPSWRDLDMMALPAQCLPWCTVVDVMAEEADFVYRFWGTGRTQMHGSDYTGRSVATMKPTPVATKIIFEYGKIMEVRAPLHIVTVGSDKMGSVYSYDSLRLPLSSDNNSINHIISFSVYGESRSAYHRLFGTEPPLYT